MNRRLLQVLRLRMWLLLLTRPRWLLWLQYYLLMIVLSIHSLVASICFLSNLNENWNCWDIEIESSSKENNLVYWKVCGGWGMSICLKLDISLLVFYLYTFYKNLNWVVFERSWWWWIGGWCCCLDVLLYVFL